MNISQRIRQWLCVHWFDIDPVKREYSEYYGAIVCLEQKTRIVTEETRTCSKCGLVDRRQVGEPIFAGWS